MNSLVCSTPIPSPSHPRQNRAIGLVRGVFQRFEGELTRGKLITSEGTEIEAVLLGKMLGLLKKHVDLSKPHLWVVYPRTRQVNDSLHLQITGLWEPQTLHAQEDAVSPSILLEDGFFSIRGEVIYTSVPQKIVIVKIRQAPKTKGDQVKFFKLKLQGTLSEQPVNRFWDLKVQRQGTNLVIVEGEDLGLFQRKPFIKRSPNTSSSQPQPVQKSLPKPRSLTEKPSLPKPLYKRIRERFNRNN